MKIQDFLKEKRWKKWKKDQWLILFLAGILLLVLALPAGSGENKEKEKREEEQEFFVQEEEQEDYVKQLETRVETVLGQIEGVGRVTVMITLQDGGESVVEKDRSVAYSSTENKQDEGANSVQQQTEESTVYENQTEEGGPFVTKENSPSVEGVLVVAQGGEDPLVRQNISESIQALFGIEIHKVKVVKMKRYEEERN